MFDNDRRDDLKSSVRREPGRVNMLRATTREQMRWVTSGVQSRGFADNGGSDRPTSRGDNRLSRMVQFKAGSLRRWREGSMLRDLRKIYCLLFSFFVFIKNSCVRPRYAASSYSII